jgi:hypothetical protein
MKTDTNLVHNWSEIKHGNTQSISERRTHPKDIQKLKLCRPPQAHGDVVAGVGSRSGATSHTNVLPASTSTSLRASVGAPRPLREERLGGCSGGGGNTRRRPAACSWPCPGGPLVYGRVTSCSSHDQFYLHVLFLEKTTLSPSCLLLAMLRPWHSCGYDLELDWNQIGIEVLAQAYTQRNGHGSCTPAPDPTCSRDLVVLLRSIPPGRRRGEDVSLIGSAVGVPGLDSLMGRMPALGG